MPQVAIKRTSNRLLELFPSGSVIAGASLGASVALTAISGVLSARLLGPSGRGTLALALVWVGLASNLADLGVSQAVTYFGSGRPEGRTQIWGQSVLIAGAQSLVVLPLAIVASAVMVASPTSRVAVVLALASMPLSLILGNQLNLLRGCERFRAYSVIRLGQSVAWTGLVAAFYVLGLASTSGLLIGFILITAGAAVWAALILFRLLGRPRFQFRGSSRLLRYGALVWVAGIGFQVNFRIDQVLLGNTVAAASLGQYAVAVSLASMLTVVSTAIAIVTLPAVARAQPDAGLAVGRRNLAVAVVTMGLLATVLAISAPTMIWKLLGASFLPAVPLFRILLLGQLALGSTQILHEIFRGQRRLRLPAAVETIGAFFTVGLLLVVIPTWGVVGAAWVSVAVYWPVALTLYVALGRGGQDQYPLRRPDESEVSEDHVAFPM